MIQNALLAALLLVGVVLVFQQYLVAVIRAIRDRVSKLRWTVAVGFALIAVVVWTAYRDAPRPPKPTPKPNSYVSEDVAEELLPFQSDDDLAAAAETWSAVFLTFSDLIEADGRTSNPLIRRVDDVRRIRDNIVAVPISGVPGGDVVAVAVGPALDDLGVGELDDAKRKTVVDLFRGVGQTLGAK